MKKPLLSILLATGVVFSFAQAKKQTGTPVKHIKSYEVQKMALDLESSSPNSTIVPYAPQATGNETRAGVVNKYKLASSYNQYSVLTEDQSCLTADQGLGMIAFTHRQCASYPKGNLPDGTGASNGSGHVQISYSLDRGLTWDTSLVVTSDGNRYPSGGIYNPAGNIDPQNAFAVVAGPSLNNPFGADAGEWASNYAASRKVDGSYTTEKYVGNFFTGNSSGTPTYFTLRNYMQVLDNGKAYIGGSDFVYDGTNYDFTAFRVLEGTFNTSNNNYDWVKKSFYHKFSRSSDGTSDNQSTSAMAWSEDGTVGYVVHIGRDSATDVLSPQPIVYKSTDGGSNWDMMPIYDFSNIQIFQDSLPNVSGENFARPYFSGIQGMDFTVDKNGNLHIISVVKAASSNDPDSLDYIWGYSPIFDVYTTSNSGWGAAYVGLIGTDEVADDGGCAINTLGYNARLQASRTEDGSKVFAIWTDTQLDGYTENCYPDIYGWAFDVETGLMTDIKSFTGTSAYQLQNYWMYVSDITFDNLDGSFSVPTTTSVAGGSDLDPMYHFYVSGIDFDEADFTVDARVPVVAEVLEMSNIKCNGDSDGSITIGSNSGKTPFTYAWGDGPTTATRTGLNVGTYSVTITDADGSSDSKSITITQPTAITMTASNDTIWCNANEAVIAATTMGGTTPYSYLWSNNAMTDSQSGLAGGSYTVTMTDGNGCTAMATSTITNNILSVTMTTNATSACGSSNGDASVSVMGGETPYSYAWSNAATDNAISGLQSGSYKVTVTDNKSCAKVKYGLVSDTSPIYVSVTNTTDASCYNQANGTLDITIMGSGITQSSPTTALSFGWTDFDGADVTSLFTSANDSSSSATALAAGDYILEVNATQTGGTCKNVEFYTIAQPDSLELTLTGNDPKCTGSNDGDAMVVAAGGNGGFMYAWTSGSTTDASSTLTQGVEMVTVTDSKGCMTIDGITLTDPAAITVTLATNDVKCNGGATGNAIANVAGGTGAFTYAWSNSSTTSAAIGLATGAVSVTVTDENMCTTSESATISEPAVLTITNIAVIDQASLGTLTPTVTGGTTPYSYSWTGLGGISYSSTSSNPSDIPNQGNYSLDVTDANGCTASETATVAGYVSIEEFNTTSNINVYPNPNNGLFTLEVNGVDRFNVIVRNTIGQVVINKTVSTKTSTVDLSTFGKGVYFLTVNNGQVQNTTRVVVK